MNEYKDKHPFTSYKNVESETKYINKYDFSFSLLDIEDFCKERNVSTEKLINDLSKCNINNKGYEKSNTLPCSRYHISVSG